MFYQGFVRIPYGGARFSDVAPSSPHVLVYEIKNETRLSSLPLSLRDKGRELKELALERGENRHKTIDATPTTM